MTIQSDYILVMRRLEFVLIIIVLAPLFLLKLFDTQAEELVSSSLSCLSESTSSSKCDHSSTKFKQASEVNRVLLCLYLCLLIVLCLYPSTVPSIKHNLLPIV